MRYFVQEGLHKWLIQDRDTGLTVERRTAKSEADTLADEMNQKADLTFSDNYIPSVRRALHEARH